MSDLEHLPERHQGGPEFRLFGPPGTGKTTTLSKMITSTAQSRGSDKVIAASFTTTAAAELAGRNLPIPKGQVGTLHALCYRAIDRPPVAEERLAEWNKLHPGLALSIDMTARRRNVDDGNAPEVWQGATPGDTLQAAYEVYRARMIDRSVWRQDVRGFAEKWEGWKGDEGVIDFTDMIETALADIEVAPGNPEVGFFDEVQDFTKLELTVIRKWGRGMERMILAGDDDQCLYRFKGATADAFLDPEVAPEDKRVLAQSWRVPKRVHAAAEQWVQKMTRREPKVYLPRDGEDGVVRHAPLSYDEPTQFVREVAKVADAGRTVMVLGACGYMLDPIKHELRREGVPFWNPYRRTRGDWNPLNPGRGVASKDRLLAYLLMDERMFGEASRLWTGGDVQRWAHVIKTQGVFKRGAKNAIADLPDRELAYGEIAALFDDEVELEQCVTPDLEWFARNLLTASRAPMEFPIQIARKRGGAALTTAPKVVIGTIHSVKGGQADVVFLLPDLSGSGAEEWSRAGEPQDSVRRQFYVGMTRAREELVICDPAGGSFVPPDQLIDAA